MTTGLSLASLGAILEALLVFVLPFELQLAHFGGVEACIHDFLVNLALLLLHRFVQIHGSLRRQE